MTEMEKANELQEKANEIQEEMKEVIKNYNEVTTKHNEAIKWLTICVVVLGILAIWTNYNQAGRYAVSGGDGGVYILDTKTSQLWVRRGVIAADFGTVQDPKAELVGLDDSEPNDDQKQ